MSRTKVAPRLREIVEDLDGHRDFLKSDHRVCAAELRCLLAVVSAAERVPDYKLVCALGMGCANPSCQSGKALIRALARLRSLSSPPSRRTARGTKEKAR